ncbi:YbaY family lipoprotein [Niveibacterium sp. 24ML]|uniref:YbaY family lipoprotein n=1 Tax=Niveibacterium sp. 24ML TaxID=2985512 RepID=UPI0022703121|nr:META domain-containing protein [Niveibacterium sp. 24ML]MCX9156292.1 YbaY family lipoprotein [Niveibacterium sp. 24ML]
MSRIHRVSQALVTAAALAFCSLAGAATLSGSASYRERIALPPGAVFEATLEDVSRADAPSTVLGRAKIDPAGAPPFRFSIDYDEAAVVPGHRYTVRATVRHEGKLLFTTDRHYPVLDGKPATPLELLLRKVGGGAVPKPAAGIAGLPASFEGTLPCADCEGTRWHLDLLADQSYRLRIEYLGKADAKPFDQIGKWTYRGKPAVLRLNSGSSDVELFTLTADGALTKLDRQGKPIASTLNYTLKRLPAYTPFEPRLVLTGMYRYLADAGVIELCSTGQTLPVATEGDNAALERAYSAARREPGTAYLVSIEGRIAERAPMEGSGTRSTVVVDRFIELMPGRCAAAPDPAAPATLKDTYWKLELLGDTPVQVADKQREAHLVMHGEPSRVAGSGGCNRLMGGYVVKGNTLRFDKLASTMMACAGGMEQELRFMAALNKVTAWRIEGQQLSLLDADGKPLARLRAVALR